MVWTPRDNIRVASGLTSSVARAVVTGAGSAAFVSVVGATAGSVATGAGSDTGAGAVSVVVATFAVVSAGLASAGFSSVFFDFLEEKIFLTRALSCSMCQYFACVDKSKTLMTMGD